jgi:hypothetical protein
MAKVEKALTEREKWEAEQSFKKEELGLRSRELEIREAESYRARWTNPLVIAILSAAVAGVGNVAATLYSSSQQRDADERKAAEARNVESEKAEASLILEFIKTQTPEKASDNLKFLVDTKLITNKARRDDMSAYLNTRREGRGVNVPPAPANLGTNSRRSCIVEGERLSAVAAAIDKITELRRFVAIDRPWLISDNVTYAKKELLFGGGPHGYVVLIVLR